MDQSHRSLYTNKEFQGNVLMIVVYITSAECGVVNIVYIFGYKFHIGRKDLNLKLYAYFHST
jgi:hypothetical protein